MEWKDIIPAIVAFLTAFLFPFIFARRKKDVLKKKKDFSQNLSMLGIQFQQIDKKDERISFLKKTSWGKKVEDIFLIKKHNIDYIFISIEKSQYGVNYFLEFIVKTPFNRRYNSIKNTKMKLKKDSFFGREYVDILWKGDDYLTQKLNLDHELKYKLFNSGLSKKNINLKVIPEKEFGYTRIKTNFVIPTYEFIYFIDSVARHIRD